MNYRYQRDVIDLDSEQEDQKIDHVMKMMAYSKCSQPQSIKGSHDSFIRNPNFTDQSKKTLEIYEILQNNNGFKRIQKLARCKICFKKVNKTNENQFQCPMCTKYCHYACMENPEECPRCKFNVSTLSYNKPSTKKTPEQKKKKTNIEIVDLDSNQKAYESNEEKSSPISTNMNVLSVKQLSEEYRTSFQQFKQKYPKYFTNSGDIKLPIEDKLFITYPFLSVLMGSSILPLPMQQKLPEYFQPLAQIWNFYASCRNLIAFDTLPYTIQNFEQALKKQPISCFIMPLLQLMMQASNKSPHNSPWFRLFDDFRSTNMLKYLGKYFWTSILAQYFTFMKKEYDDNQLIPVIQKLNLMQEKRQYEMSELSQKILILSYIVQFFENQAIYRALLNDAWRKSNNKLQKILSQQNEAKQKIKTTQLKIEQQYTKIKQKITNLKSTITAENKEEVEMTFKKLTLQKQQIKKELDNVKQQMRNIKSDQQSIQFLNDMQNCNKIVFIGKDRNSRCYWYITYTQAEDIIFVSETASNLNNTDSQVKYKWGFYHCSEIQNLILTLNDAGSNQYLLKSKLQQLKSKRIIRTSSSQKLSNAKSLFKNYSEVDRNNNDDQVKQIQEFLSNNIKDINLSELRKLLVESQRIFSNHVKKHVGVWKINDIYENRTKNEKFKNLNEIKNFIIDFSSAMYGLKQDQGPKNGRRGKQKGRSQLWKHRNNEFFNWKKLLQNSTKNTEVFMLVMALYLETVYSSNENKQPPRTNFQSKTNNRDSSSDSSEQFQTTRSQRQKMMTKMLTNFSKKQSS